MVKNALAKIAKARGFGEPRFHVESGSSAGDGYTSVMFRVNLNGTDARGKADSLSVMCKTTISDNMMMAGVFKTEDCIYKSVLPAMENIAALKEPLPWPRCYHSDVGGEKPCIVLGDLGVDNFTMADRRVPLDVKHCRLALSQLARYHGAGLALRHLKPDEFQYMADTLGASYANKEMLEAFQHFFTTIENAADILLDKFPEGSEERSKLQRLLSSFPEEFIRSMHSPPDGPGCGIIHGDCHINNMMFQYETVSGEVTGCKLIDFQTSRFGATAMDLGSLLVACTDKATRDEHWDDLLRGYHRELQDTLRSSGIMDPDSIYSWDQFMVRMQEAVRYGVCWTPMALHAFLADAQGVQELHDSVKGLGDTIGSKQLTPTPTFKIQASPQMVQRFGDVVQSALDWGWL